MHRSDKRSNKIPRTPTRSYELIVPMTPKIPKVPMNPKISRYSVNNLKKSEE